MNTFVLATNSGAGSSVMMIVMLAVLFGFTYFTMIKPQKKQQQERQDMMSKLQKGDSVEMVDGLRGKIDSINDADKTVVLDADGIYLTFSRLAVRTVLKKADAAQASEAPVKEDAAEAENKETAAPVDKADADSAEDEK
ncbi:Preprotein translocase, YajC subunit [Lactobacillus equicursoris 66c]|uniref:Preprotein translocase, YajC subunit n=2 Tax=Lactobacillus equicursoris TaxID=420645 RepID=K0NTF8_9LACO|nr:preprotein translocase subunit YajC [Lactobacillus equicursoris]MST80000.1 preprotein translocase subunit YajC [Lactobacillus equicursoris]CCK84503.1 Preprotein translocase, YajC subunit [Lactobacillus equicursoris 66c]